MHAYPFPGRGRISPDEIAGYIAEQTGGAVAAGLERVLELGDGRAGGGRVAGFMETHDLREWLIPLEGSDPTVIETQPAPVTDLPRTAFALSIGFGNGSPLPQPSGQWDLFVNDRFAVSVRVVNHSQVWRGEEAALAFAAQRIETAEPFGRLELSSALTNEGFAAFGPALLSVPTAWLQAGRPATLRIQPRAAAPTTRWMQLAAAPGILIHSDIYQAVDGLRGERPQAGGYALYFGDIHTHSGQIGDQEDVSKGCGMGSREENYAYAKGPGGLDFYALTDHEYQFEGDAGAYFGLAQAWDDPGRFACLPGYEHTSLCYGHRNVYFRGPGGAVVNATASGGGPTRDLSDATPPGELWRQLEANGVPFMTVPHHPSSASHPCSWDFYDPRYDRLVEVYSTWGSSEYYGDFPKGVTDRYRGLDVREALGRGMRMGLIASADGHDGHPGNAQSPFAKHHHQFHPLGSGRAVVLAEELTRKAVFDALYARRCYATTGPPIVLDFRVNGALMGCELPSSQRPPIVQLRAEGTNGLDHVRIVKDGRVVHTAACHGRRSFELEWSDDAYRPYVPAFYYVRVVQVDGESAWSSPVWLG